MSGMRSSVHHNAPDDNSFIGVVTEADATHEKISGPEFVRKMSCGENECLRDTRKQIKATVSQLAQTASKTDSDICYLNAVSNCLKELQIFSTYIFNRTFYNSRSADTYVNDRICFCNPMESSAINGLSGALQNTTNFCTSKTLIVFCKFWAVSLTISPINFTASILIPVFVEPTSTEEHTKSVSANALIERTVVHLLLSFLCLLMRIST